VNARPETIEWLKRYYELIDHNEVGEVLRNYIAEGCTFRFGNAPATDFLDEARRMATLIKGVQHRLVSVLEGDDGTIACELEVTYLKHDGSSVTLPGSLFARIAGGRFVEQRAYVDQTPLLPT
jgi:hypothetical protein